MGAVMNGKLEHSKHSTVLLSLFRWDKWCFAFSISSLPKESDRKLSSPLSYNWEVIARPCCKLFYWSKWWAQYKRLHIPEVGHTSWPFTGGLQRQCSEGSLRTNPLLIPCITCASSLLQPFCRSKGQSQFDLLEWTNERDFCKASIKSHWHHFWTVFPGSQWCWKQLLDNHHVFISLALVIERLSIVALLLCAHGHCLQLLTFQSRVDRPETGLPLRGFLHVILSLFWEICPGFMFAPAYTVLL